MRWVRWSVATYLIAAIAAGATTTIRPTIRLVMAGFSAELGGVAIAAKCGAASLPPDSGDRCHAYAVTGQPDDHSTLNCAVRYSNVAQHYEGCWFYNLGADGDSPFLDGGVGPHVENRVLTSLGLTLQSTSGIASQVNRIARFTRW